ncbi:RNA 2',3'-cyclic phosphodiesterase [Alteromonas pelagimontana]|uniref:RNA 2',3'-cyclic phosphodiesterase n=1 Tax=Alteromonas pelagimontana TaxID=1858656 RepID=A0A6M4MC37_9ALTE|nr:RNA 2',3'-cyclic phosphodiesterase [Alteromonas pelagimontana]QJR80609.1 RNA 2',3'-cyclic phosphodiesterase [Alteromonas pelagimontana]
MRCFIGLDLAPKEKLSLESWRQQALPEISPREPAGKKPVKKRFGASTAATPVAVPAANYHITLAFLGDVTPRQHEALIQALDDISAPPLTLCLDSTGMWGGPKIMFAAPTKVPEELTLLAKQIRQVSRRVGIALDNREYLPHVTLVRKVTAAVPAPLLPPSVTCSFNHFHLFESVSTPSGVVYPVRQSWQLQSLLSIREQLKRGLI